MLPYFDISSAIQWQLRRIEEKCAKELRQIDKPGGLGAKALVDMALKYWTKERHNAITYLVQFYLLVKRRFAEAAVLDQVYRMGWIFSWYNDELPFVKINCSEKVVHFKDYWLFPHITQKYIERYEETMADVLKSLGGELGISPQGRYMVDRHGELAVGHAHYVWNLCCAQEFIQLERNLEAAECIFRAKHALALGDPPRHLGVAPCVEHVSPALNCLESWLEARAVSDRGARKAIAWIALYWLIENHFACHGKLTKYWTIYTQHIPYQIMAEFELFDEDQEEFLRYHHQYCWGGSYSLLQRTLEENRPILKLADLNAPTMEELKAEQEIAMEKQQKKKERQY